MYNLDLEQTKHITHGQFKSVTGVVKTGTDVIVCDSTTGVHHLNQHGEYLTLICAGCFSDVCLTNTDTIYALEHKERKIHTFVRNQNGWVTDTRFKLVKYSNYGHLDKLCTTKTHLYVSSCDTNCVFVYTLSGEFRYETGECGSELGQFNCPYFSDVDSRGKLLLCDWHNRRLKVFDAENRQWSEVSGLQEMQWPVCAGVGDEHLWVGAGLGMTQLLKYEVV